MKFRCTHVSGLTCLFVKLFSNSLNLFKQVWLTACLAMSFSIVVMVLIVIWNILWSIKVISCFLCKSNTCIFPVVRYKGSRENAFLGSKQTAPMVKVKVILYILSEATMSSTRPSWILVYPLVFILTFKWLWEQLPVFCWWETVLDSLAHSMEHSSACFTLSAWRELALKITVGRKRFSEKNKQLFPVFWFWTVHLPRYDLYVSTLERWLLVA